ncbi:BTB/POZ domain-containing protein At1g21780 [Folsomia candida]|nr:BTB/POZ domain-containing protein At1g21780 [Folsomia candida]
MSKYVRDSDRPSNPWKLDRCNENLSLEQICHKLGSNNLKLTITMKIYGKQSITVSVKDSPPPSMATEQAKHIQNQRKVMLAMLDTGLESDVTFVTRDDQRISAHKCILSMHSTVFAAMFAAEMKEKTDGVVKLVDMGGEGLKILLKFLYTGELENTWGKFYQEIVNAANKYQITQLISMCDKILPTVVSLENCVELLKFTELHGMTDATEKVKNFMKRDPQELLQLWHVAAFGSRLDHDSSSYSGPENDFYKYYARPDFVRPNYVEPDYYVRYDSADEDWD